MAKGSALVPPRGAGKVGPAQRAHLEQRADAAAGIESIARMLIEHRKGPTEYADPDTKDRDGLRVGLYKEWAIPDKDNADPKMDRDPHHVVQYLLLQYLTNQHSTKDPATTHEAFPLKKALPDEHTKLGITGSGGTVHQLISAGRTIDMYRYAKGRGGEMPVILLSKHAHRASIHLPGTSPDEKFDTQAGGVARWFHAALGPVPLAWLNVPEGVQALADADKDDTLVPDPRGLTGADVLVLTTRETVSRAVWNAARTTYDKVWNHMQTTMQKEVPRREVEYYAAVVAERSDQGAPIVTEDQVNHAIRKVVARNTVLGTKAGFS
ncbi:MAG: hypothetical protein KF773_09780 [Deltaproteobacteria bacterium]|nr:hypothetical protein [Deltaproteobacteria bacterium]